MPVLNPEFRQFIIRILQSAQRTQTDGYLYDPLLAVLEATGDPRPSSGTIPFVGSIPWEKEKVNQIQWKYLQVNIIEAFNVAFENGILEKGISVDGERKTVILKNGFPTLPATTCSTILKGLRQQINTDQALAIYASYGMSRNTKSLAKSVNFTDINRRANHLQQLLDNDLSKDNQTIHQRYMAIHAYLAASPRHKEHAIVDSGIPRSQFFFYLRSFKQYGTLGLIDKAREPFRCSKIGFVHEAQLVIDKLRHPERSDADYVDRFKSKGIHMDRSTVAKIFARWNVKVYRCEFAHNLERLDAPEPDVETTDLHPDPHPSRLVDQNFLIKLSGLKTWGLPVDAPGLFALWYYLEELQIVPILQTMGLTGDDERRGYAWIDHLLLDVGRTFYGISSYSRTCKHEELSLAFFAHLLTAPCNDTFLDGIASTTEAQLFALRRWLIKRGRELGLFAGKRIGFDFHQIDMDVWLSELREFGKGPSPKKKICWEGFRPHIAWDLDTGCLIVAEFRKSSARGTSTIKRFVTDHLLDQFGDLFESVYIDSEYTGKDVWQFILDANGMDAHLTACLKQNAFVKRVRDDFLNTHAQRQDFWKSYDDDHVYADEMFSLTWSAKPKNKGAGTPSSKSWSLTCVVKKHLKTGKYRCFGTSKPVSDPPEVLNDYSHRWSVENGIKDLVHSYFLDFCPGANPHQVDSHFWVVSLCRLLYRMIERDLSDAIKNADGSTRTLRTMREILFRQGPAHIHFDGSTIRIKFLDSFSVTTTRWLRGWFDLLNAKFPNGLDLLGGLRLSFELRPPRGKEHRNTLKKVPLSTAKRLPRK